MKKPDKEFVVVLNEHITISFQLDYTLLKIILFFGARRFLPRETGYSEGTLN